MRIEELVLDLEKALSENAELKASIKAMEEQEPVVWWMETSKEDFISRTSPVELQDPENYQWVPLYAAPTTAMLDKARDEESEECAKVCESMGALEALDGEEEGNAAMVRVADRQADLCAAAIRERRVK